MRKFTALLGLALLSQGCMVAKYVRPEAPVPADWSSAPTPATDADATPAAALGWRSFFTDPSLQADIETALDNNRDLRVALLRIERAQASFRRQFATMLPDANLNFNMNNAKRVVGPDFTTQGTVFNAGIDFPQFTLDLFGYERYQTLSAKHEYLATIAGARAAQITLISQVAAAWVTERSVSEQKDIASRLLDSWQDALDIQQARFDAGLSSELDLAQAQALVATARSTLADLEHRHAAAVESLRFLLGAPEEPPQAGSLADLGVTIELPAGLPSEVLANRPDILEAEEHLRARHADIGTARAAFFPQISLTGSVGTASTQLSGLFGAGAGVWSWIPSLLMPLFNIPAKIAALRVAKVDQEIAIAQYESAIQAGFRDVATALNSREPLKRQIEALSVLRDTQQRRSDLATLRYDQGFVDYLSRLDAERSLLQAEQSLITAKATLINNAISLYAALGGGQIEHTGDDPEQDAAMRQTRLNTRLTHQDARSKRK